ncbi:methylase of polypeptide subunit release factors [Sphingomonas naasensis]|uniref:Class I SAM-dependent methyltransferase n=1 Tax=Sphingomonas naasensis TaxID=1344951 RepID=A0A4S1W2P7_9SPHN|nr:class I SAM-dependent methyltransferase [Sphingomonas naasensis]NIJ19690.1 methylase of polypeptide subunit release factors [Sphingomonas naasensis]TGX37104.1 class I SAM-dependent methyltransferase [Sphingomonas naasensis]
MTGPGLTEADAALLRLLDALRRRGYRFVTPTPATHARVIARPDRRVARDLADILGWSLPFAPTTLDPEILALLEAAGAIERTGALLRSVLRVASLRERLFLHSAYPTEAEDSVFFGPDSYRFADLIAAELAGAKPAGGTIVDIGTGAGVGAIVAAILCPEARVVMTDVNPRALRLAAVNARAAGVAIRAVESGDLRPIDGAIDLALANPPYIIDPGARTYRDGGAMYGGQVSVDMARMAVARLSPQGRLILYTGSAIVRGEDLLGAALAGLAAKLDCRLDYRELDPDMFGEELDNAAYAEVDRIAVVAAIFTKR